MIDWFTVAAQIVNFLVLVALLKHFLYGPIVNAMDEREEKIAQRRREADDKAQQAEQEAEEYRRNQQALEERRDNLLEEARRAAGEERKQRLKQAREEADALSRQWRSSVERERDAFLGEIRETLSRHAVAIARKVLADLADAPLEQAAARSFAAQLGDMSDEERDALKESVDAAEGKIVVRTAFELGDEERNDIAAAIRKQTGTDASLDVERSDDVIAGIELRMAGRKLAWSLGDYLGAAADEIDRLLQAAAGAGREREAGDSNGEKPEKDGESDAEDDDS